MYEEPDEDQTPAERASTPADRAKDKADEFRMHAELAAVFEGKRKFDARIVTKLDADVARDVQRTIAKLEKARVAESPLLPPESSAEAARLLALPATRNALSTNDYHIHRRPGEVMILRWLAGEEVDAFYGRLQAHFDAALNHFREEERQARGWKQDPETLAYLAALNAVEVKMPDRYLRDPIRKHGVSVLSTQAADELDILHLSDVIMGVGAAEIVGDSSAPPDAPTEQDRTWFFKLFALRGIVDGVEQMCFFTFLQKSDDDGGW